MSDDSRDGLLAVSGTFLGLSTIAVGLRFYARKQQKATLMADDYLMIPALLSYIAACICIFLMVQDKILGYSLMTFPTVEEAEATIMGERSSKLQIALDVTTTTVLACVKLSALFFYRRIFCVGGRTKWFSVATMVTIVIVILWLVIFQFLTGFQCGTHFSALWDGTYLQYCTISFPFLYGLAISDFLLDVWILALPIPLIMRLHAARSKKLSIIGVFLLAFVGLGASIARMVQYIQIELGGATYFITNDEELALTKAFYLAMLETGMSLVAVNLPSLWLLCTSVIPEKVVRSVRSILSLPSQRGSGGSSGRVGGGESTTRVANNKLPSTDSTRPSLPSNSSQVGRLHNDPHQFRDDLEGQKYEAYAMHKINSKENAEPGYPLPSEIHREDTVEVRHE